MKFFRISIFLCFFSFFSIKNTTAQGINSIGFDLFDLSVRSTLNLKMNFGNDSTQALTITPSVGYQPVTHEYWGHPKRTSLYNIGSYVGYERHFPLKEHAGYWYVGAEAGYKYSVGEFDSPYFKETIRNGQTVLVYSSSEFSQISHKIIFIGNVGMRKIIVKRLFFEYSVGFGAQKSFNKTGISLLPEVFHEYPYDYAYSGFSFKVKFLVGFSL